MIHNVIASLLFQNSTRFMAELLRERVCVM